MKNMTEWPAAPRMLRPELPQTIENVLRKALAKQPEQRYQTANEFLSAFKNALVLGSRPIVQPRSQANNPGHILRQVSETSYKLSMVVGTRSNPGIRYKHRPNEDSIFALQGSRTQHSQSQMFGLFAVADGRSDRSNGQDASRLAIQTIIDFLLPRITNEDYMDDAALSKLLYDGIQISNQAVYRRNLENTLDAGTTMTTTLIMGQTAYVANVGDSRTYHYRTSEGLRKVTFDHSVAASLVEAGMIQPDDIYTHPNAEQLSRSLGEKLVVEVDSFQVDLHSGDKLLLCSDGLWFMVRDALIQDVLTRTGDPNEASENLIKAALEGGGEGNISVIIVQFTETNKFSHMSGIHLLAKPETVTVPNLYQI